MAVITDHHRKYTPIELEIHLEANKCNGKLAFFDVILTFQLGDKYPKIITPCTYIEIDDIQELINGLEGLGSQAIYNLDFTPLDPDFTLKITHSGRGKYEKEDRYNLFCFIDIHHQVYCGSGLTLEFDVNRTGICQFAEDLRKEYEVIMGNNILFE